MSTLIANKLQPLTGDEIDVQGHELVNLKASNVSEPVFTADLTSGVVTLDFENGGIQVVNLTENVTSFTLTNFTAGKALTVYFIQDETGGRTVDFTQFRTAGGEGVALSDAADAIDVVVMLTIDGTNYDAGLSMGALA